MNKSMRANRAAQFAPFDSLKGLHEEFKAREEKMSRCEKKELSDEENARLSEMILQIEKGMTIEVVYYRGGHYHNISGKLKEKSITMRYIVMDNEKISFATLQDIKIVD